MIKFIHRKQLFLQLWDQPMTKIAPQYNLSTYDLKKICDGLLIPLPKAGHWSKVKYGKIIPTPLLPSILNKLQPYKYNKNIKLDQSTVIKNPIEHTIQIRVKKTLSNPHPLIGKTKATLKSILIDEYGMKKVVSNGIDFRASKINENRALRIMDTIFCYLEKNGAKIIYPYENNIHTYVLIDNEKIQIGIEEKSKYIGMIEKKYGSYVREERGYKPTGILSLVIRTYGWGSGLRKTWSDGSTGELEEKIGEFIDGVYNYAKFMKQRTIERNIEEEARAKARKERAYIKQCEELEQRMSEELIEDTKNFSQSQQIYSYIQEVKKRAAIKYPDQMFPEELSDWFDWAEQHANRLDPLNNGLPGYKHASKQIKIEDVL